MKKKRRKEMHVYLETTNVYVKRQKSAIIMKKEMFL
jgi:hypothetical protein